MSIAAVLETCPLHLWKVCPTLCPMWASASKVAQRQSKRSYCFADDKPFAFEAALQSHVGTHEVRLMEALGFKGKLMLNCDASPDRPLLRMCEEESSTYGGTCACPGRQCCTTRGSVKL